MAKQPTTQDDLAEMAFPSGGLELTHPSLMGRPDTTPVAENVRWFEPLTGRGRGGSRPGIDPFIDEQVSGDNAIQHLATIVTVDAEMLDYSFDGPNQEFPGVYGGIGFIELDLNLIGPFDFPAIPTGGPGETFVGGSGYAPKDPKKKTTLTISTPNAEWPINSDTVITINLTDGDGNPFALGNKAAMLYTDPPGEVGDGVSSIIVGGAVDINVSSASVKRIQYSAKAFSNTGSVVAISNKVWVRYTDDTPPPPPGLVYANSAGVSNAGSPGTTLHRNLNVTTGDLVLVFFGVPQAISNGTTIGVTDSQGNTYTLIDTYLRETSNDVFATPMVMAAFWTLATATNTMTMNFVASESCEFGVAIHQITGAHPTTPIAVFHSNTVHGAGAVITATTGSVAASSGNMIIANFVSTGLDMTLPGTGYTVASMVQGASGQCERHENVSGPEAATGSSTGQSYVAIGVAIRKAP